MNRFLKVALIGAVVATSISADDFLAKATNGALSDTQIGVVKLDNNRMTNVKGGYTVSRNTFTLINRVVGNSSIKQIGKVIFISEAEQRARALGYYGSEAAGSGYYAGQRYNEAVSVADPQRGELLAITATLTKIPSYFGTPIPKFEYGAVVLKVTSDGSLYRLRSANLSSYIASDAMRYEKNNLSRELVVNQ